jgi:acetyl esterase/lipase
MITASLPARCLCGTLLLLAVGTSAFAMDEPPAPAPRRAGASNDYPPKMEGADVAVYKTAGDVRLNAYVFKPAGWQATDKRPAVVFFFGGGWTNGSPARFEQHCRYFAGRGMVAVAADYRVKSRHGVSPDACVADAKSAVRWLRANAAKLGVDPKRVAAGGGSAGGHIAACAAVIAGFDEAGEDRAVSSKPDALVLFNPALDVESDRFKHRFGEHAADLSPVAHVRPGAPPTIIFHGKADTTVPYTVVERFTQLMKEAGNRCEIVGFEGQQHGFFNYRGPDGGPIYRQTVKQADAFLVSLGYLPAAATPPAESRDKD